MRFDQFSVKWILALVALLATICLSAGCGGGGGGGGGSSSTSGSTSGGGSTTYAYSGQVVDQSNPPVGIVGETVSFDGNAAYRATTGTNGTFLIAGVPASAITGSDFLIVSDPSGVEIASYALTAGTKGGSNITITLGPPPPPTGLTRKR